MFAKYRLLFIPLLCLGLLGALVLAKQGATTANAAEPTQILLVSSYDSDQVLIYDAATGAWAGELFTPPGVTLDGPTGLAVGPDGNYYVASAKTNAILRYESSSWNYKDTFVAAGSGGLLDPQGIAFGPDGNLYVSSGTNQILHYDNTGAFKGVFAADGGLNTPQGLTFGPDKHLYVVDLINSSVLQFDGSSGAYIGPFTSGEILNIPTGLIFGPDGDLYVTSTGNNAIFAFAGDTGRFRQGWGGSDLDAPAGLAFGPDQILYVANKGTYLNNVGRYDVVTMQFQPFIATGVGGLNAPRYLLFTEKVLPSTATPTPTATPTSTPTATVTATPVPGTACASVQISDIPTVWTVNTTVDNDFTALTLRCALLHANRRDTIRFDPAVFPPAAPATIRLITALPALDQGELTIDGAGAGVIVDGSNLPAGTSGLVIRSDGNRVAHLQIVNMPLYGIVLAGNDNVIGATLPLVSAVIPDISGPPAAPVNLISGNGSAGIRIDGHRNHVLGNYIGTTASGLAAQPNGVGVLLVGGTANRIGAGADHYGNLISGNRTNGIELEGDLTHHNRIEGNYVGANGAGTAALANQEGGILLHSGAHSNLIGSDRSGSGNLISGNGFSGIRAEGVLSLTVQANYIGTDLQGAVALPNAQHGILLRDSSYATIGGPRTETGNHCDGGCNLIAGNSQIGLVITGRQSRENLVQANFIGTDVSGSKAVANGGSGVWLAEGAGHNTLTGNVISGNQGSGVLITGEATAQNKVFGNSIGMDLALLQALGNEVGIRIEQNAHHNVVGGIAPGEANTIAGNRSHGVYLRGSETAFNQIARNFIGLTEAGLEYTGGNGGNGVFLEAGAHVTTWSAMIAAAT
ncbi:MAG: right-handed parallel beta-helix repeat-containing protein [Caldilineaceae bacterium]